MIARTAAALVLFFLGIGLPVWSLAQKAPTPGHYLFAWAGDVAQKGQSFLAVIDADPRSASYGRLMTTLATGQKTVNVHHTEYTMRWITLLPTAERSGAKSPAQAESLPHHKTVPPPSRAGLERREAYAARLEAGMTSLLMTAAFFCATSRS